MADRISDAMPDKFDRLMGLLTGLTDTMSTRPSTVRVVPTLGVGGTSVYIVQTFRQHQRNDEGRVISSDDTIFLEMVDENGSLRVALPPPVAEAIARQRDAIGGRARSRAGKARAAADKKAGRQPGFMRKRRS